MTGPWLPFACGVAVLVVGLHGLLSHRDLFRKVLALNVLGSGVFILLIAGGQMHKPADRVPDALVLTGIVVAISATALALTLARRLYEETGHTELSEPAPDEDDPHG